MGKQTKKNEEKTPVIAPKKGILAFFSSSAKKVSTIEKANSPDSVESVEVLTEVTLAERFTSQSTETFCDEKTPLTSLTTNQDLHNHAITEVKLEDSSTLPSKIFPLFQKKPKEKSNCPIETIDSAFDVVSIPQSPIEVLDDEEDSQRDAPLLMSNLSSENSKILEQKEAEMNSVSEVENELQPKQLFAEIVGGVCDEEIEKDQQQEIAEVIEVKEPETTQMKEAEGGEYRRSARIRTKQVEIAKKMEEQRKLLESSDDDSCKLIKRDSGGVPKKRSARKTENEYHSDEDPPASSRKKKVAAIFVSKEEKARLAAEEKERKAREAALIEQERLLKLAEERERRIQEEMKNIKQFNDERLGATKQENSTANPFFVARSNLKVISLVGEEGPGTSDSKGHDLQDLKDIESFPSISDVLRVIDRDYIREQPLEDRKPCVILDTDYFKGVHAASHRLYDTALDLSAFRSIWVNYMAYLNRFSIKSPSVIDISDEDSDKLDKKMNSPQSLAKSPYEQVLSHQRVKILSWLESWKNRRLSATGANYMKPIIKLSKQFIDDDVDSLADTISEFSEADVEEQLGRGVSSLNDDSLAVYVIVGGTGAGKTSLAYECARAVGASVIEINSTQVRSAVVIKRLISEATQSTTINKDQIILFDEADVFFEEEDTGFHSAILKLASTTKSPVIITVRKFPQSLYSLPANICVLQPPTYEELANTLSTSTFFQNFKSSSETFTSLGLCSSFDVRGAFQTLALYPDQYTLMQLSSDHSLQNFLTENCFDFSLFDAINFSSSFKTHVILNEDVITKAIFQPSINCVYPHFVGLTGTEDTIITIQGENFLQAIHGDVVGSTEEIAPVKVYFGSFEVTIIEHEDKEIRFTLPRSGLSRGFYSIRLQLSFIINSLTQTTISHSSNGGNEAWVVVSELYPMDFSKYLMTSCCRSYTAFTKNNEVVKMFTSSNAATSATKSTKKRKKSRLIKRHNMNKSTSEAIDEEEKAAITHPMEVDEERDEEIDDDEDFLAIDESLEDSAGAGKKKMKIMFEDDENENEGADEDKLVDVIDETNEEDAPIKRRKVLIEDNEDERNDEKAEILNEQDEMDGNEDCNRKEVREEDKSLIAHEIESTSEKLLKANEERQTQQNKSVVTNNRIAADTADVLAALDSLSYSYDYISAIDRITREISDYTILPDEDDSPSYSSDPSRIILNLESVRRTCFQEFGNYGKLNQQLHPQSRSFSTDFLHFESTRAYKVHRFEYELSCFHDQSLSHRLVYSESLPYFHLIGSSSIIYEEKEKEFQRILDAEKKATSRSRRLQSHNEKNNTPVKEGPSYQYLKEMTHLEEASFKGLLEHFYDHLKLDEAKDLFNEGDPAWIHESREEKSNNNE